MIKRWGHRGMHPHHRHPTALTAQSVGFPFTSFLLRHISLDHAAACLQFWFLSYWEDFGRLVVMGCCRPEGMHCSPYDSETRRKCVLRGVP